MVYLLWREVLGSAGGAALRDAQRLGGVVVGLALHGGAAGLGLALEIASELGVGGEGGGILGEVAVERGLKVYLFEALITKDAPLAFYAM